MVALVAALTCLSGGCAPRAPGVDGRWSLVVRFPQVRCTGTMRVRTVQRGRVRGRFSICGDLRGTFSGRVRSNELVLRLEPYDDAAPLPALLNVSGAYLSGALGEGKAEGWRGSPPGGSPRKRRVPARARCAR